MSDRELLELAAKAYGATHAYAGRCCGIEGRRRDGAGLLCDNDLYWDPLTDDGDALRLAVKLRMVVSLADCMCCATVDWHGNEEDNEVRIRFSEGFSDREAKDALEATRRAIVHAAAEIGRAMP